MSPGVNHLSLLARDGAELLAQSAVRAARVAGVDRRAMATLSVLILSASGLDSWCQSRGDGTFGPHSTVSGLTHGGTGSTKRPPPAFAEA
jgi:hypothetical protein